MVYCLLEKFRVKGLGISPETAPLGMLPDVLLLLLSAFCPTEEIRELREKKNKMEAEAERLHSSALLLFLDTHTCLISTYNQRQGRYATGIFKGLVSK
jgi:hypothetical protein